MGRLAKAIVDNVDRACVAGRFVVTLVGVT